MAALKASQLVDDLVRRGYVKTTVWSFPEFAITKMIHNLSNRECVIVHGIKDGEFTDVTLEIGGHPIEFLNSGKMHKAASLKEEIPHDNPE